MFGLRKQAASGERPVPSLRQSLKRPHPWCAILFALIASVVVDVCRKPGDQITGNAYVRLVRIYQMACSPYLANHVRCRYVPTCSRYSIQAVRGNGIVTGLRLTAARIHRCRKSVSLGTYDPAPKSNGGVP